jgi:hypothetical protein
MKGNLASRVEKLRAQLEELQRRDTIGGWIHAGETADEALARLIACGRIADDSDHLQLARWLTAEEAVLAECF